MRTIKFRGLRTDGKGWVIGFYYEYNGKSIISSEDHSDDADTYYNDEVIPDSVGQFTGLTDKNVKECFEGDVLKCDNMIIVIKYSANAFEGIYLKPKYLFSPLQNKNYLQWEIIGNIHENPELCQY